jgi:hypothetical protein
LRGVYKCIHSLPVCSETCIVYCNKLFLLWIQVYGEVAEDYPRALAPLIAILADSAGADVHCTPRGPVCYNCSTAPICLSLPNGNSLLLGSYNCAEQDPKEPYCNDGLCSATASQDCSQEFQCTGKGYFPDPDDCQTFHFCNASLNVTTYTCAANYVYLHTNNSCVRKKVPADCAIIKCKYARPVEYVVYPKDPSVYGVCVRDQRTVVARCSEGQEFDTKSSQCKFACKQEGVFPADGCRKFYECVNIALNKYNIVEGECPVGTYFNAVIGGCATGDC